MGERRDSWLYAVKIEKRVGVPRYTSYPGRLGCFHADSV